MNEHGFIRVAVNSPELKVANPIYNIGEHVRMTVAAANNGASLIVFPELSLTGYTCGDLFFQKILQKSAVEALQKFALETEGISAVVIVGLPLSFEDRLYNCAAVLQNGTVLGFVPKTHLPNYKEFYEKRWFSSGFDFHDQIEEIDFMGNKIPFGQMIFRCADPGFTLGVEICEDLWMPIPPSSYLSLRGADIIANLSASNELVAKADYRKNLISQQSARCICAYLYAGSGVHESTTDVVFSGDCLIYENGQELAAAKRFARTSQVVYADIDMDILRHDRQINKSFADNWEHIKTEKRFRVIEFAFPSPGKNKKRKILRKISKNPFVPQEDIKINERCEEIFNIQVAGLAKRIEHTGSVHPVIGVSGGLDSTLALLVTAKTMEALKLPAENIISVTMPGFGTTGQTYKNALALMKELNSSVREIDISKACLQHFGDIGHDPEKHDVTYENVQARERTQILMDIANKSGGFVVGTGDLSELALGWATYNGDHMSMYGVNSGVPKTLVRFLVEWAANNIFSGKARKILYRISETPISPELLPPDEQGRIRQKTEELIGPYMLHDFFLFYMMRYGMPPEKILFLAAQAYADEFSTDEIKAFLRIFYQRFFRSQFKRSCMPDGPKVGSINLSPRGDWRMPSDADVSAWLKKIE